MAWTPNAGNDSILGCKHHIKSQNRAEKPFDRSQEQEQTAGDITFVWKCTPVVFQRKTANNETVSPSWLGFSAHTGKVYCYVCKFVVTRKGKLSVSGFCASKHGNERLAEHEKLKLQLEAVTILAWHGKNSRHIDQDLAKQEDELRENGAMSLGMLWVQSSS